VASKPLLRHSETVPKDHAQAALSAMFECAISSHDEYVQGHLPGMTFKDHFEHRLGGTAQAYAVWDMTAAYRLMDSADRLAGALRDALTDEDDGTLNLDPVREALTEFEAARNPVYVATGEAQR
jgi:phosphoglycolate phosphatase-like HAD superfamily hydrolase